jgi:hypothetical protein
VSISLAMLAREEGVRGSRSGSDAHNELELELSRTAWQPPLAPAWKRDRILTHGSIDFLPT